MMEAMLSSAVFMGAVVLMGAGSILAGIPLTALINKGGPKAVYWGRFSLCVTAGTIAFWAGLSCAMYLDKIR